MHFAVVSSPKVSCSRQTPLLYDHTTAGKRTVSGKNFSLVYLVCHDDVVSLHRELLFNDYAARPEAVYSSNVFPSTKECHNDHEHVTGYSWKIL